MAFNINMNNFVIDRVLRAVGKSKAGDVLFAINQVTNPSLSVTSETSEAVDALGSRIAVFNRAKSCEFSAENALFDMNLMAVQAGSEKGVIRGAVKEVPAFDPMENGNLHILLFLLMQLRFMKLTVMVLLVLKLKSLLMAVLTVDLSSKALQLLYLLKTNSIWLSMSMMPPKLLQLSTLLASSPMLAN